MRLIFITLLLTAGVCFAQENDSIPLPENNTKLVEAAPELLETEVMDSIIDGQVSFSKEIPLVVNDDNNPVLVDDAFAAAIDQKWREELYNTALFDTIYKSVSELSYEEVDYADLPTDTLKARLEELNARTPFNIEYNPSLESVIKSYLKNRRHSLTKLMALSHYYFPMFEKELDNYNIPLEIKYLAIVESALKPRAKSRVGATGLWQFMFATGKQYGLDISSYVDERSDPLKSTDAAAKYLARLYELFGDWDLALAAYNSGPGNVSKAIRRSGGYENYWILRPFLPRETAGYLPAFLATMYIFEFAEEHGFEKSRPQFTYIETDTVHVKYMISLDQVSKLTGVHVEELQFLNPSYKLDIIPVVKGENYTLRLPREHIGAFVNNEKQIYAYAKKEFEKREVPLPQMFNAKSKERYRVRSGDYLGKIARKFGVGISQIKKWNGLRSNHLKIGQYLTIYPRIPSIKTVSSRSSSNTKKAAAPSGTTYIVKSGDSLWSISQKYPGVSIQNIREWNDIRGSILKPGMKLIVSK